jgi:protein pelota
MKLLKTDRQEGFVHIELENQDDLWYMKDLIAEGDEVRAKTQRTKLDGREKKTCSITLRVEKTEYQRERLRVTGEMTRAPDDVELGYHTFNLNPGDRFKMWKDFTDEEWSRLLEAEDQHSYEVLFCLVQKGEADFFLVKESGIQDLSSVDINIPGKMYASDESSDFYNQLTSIIKRSIDDVDSMILGGPGFEKEKVYNMLDEEIQEKTFLQDTSVTGKTGLYESIKRGALDKVVESSRIGEESEAVEEFLERLQTDDRVSYGEGVEDLIEMGAVEKLLLTAEKMRRNPELARKTEQKGGEVQVIHIDHESGERFEQFGGIAAILRYEV